MILAIDTSNEQASVALLDGTALRSEWSWTAGRNHSRQLTRAIETVLEMEGMSPADLSAVIVASGPGSFSGVRVGISHAKGLTMALGIPLVGISTLDVIAFQTSMSSVQVWAVIPAGRGEVYVAQYAGGSETWTRVGDYMLLPAEEAASLIDSSHLVAGPGAELVARGSELTARHPWLALRRAGFLAELGRRYLASGGHDQLDSLEPLYLRLSAAEERRTTTKGSPVSGSA